MKIFYGIALVIVSSVVTISAHAQNTLTANEKRTDGSSCLTGKQQRDGETLTIQNYG